MPPGILGHGTTDQSVASQLDVSQINDRLLGDGTHYYVSTLGDDGNAGLNFDNAFRTIIYAVSVAQPHDVIVVGDGIFDETANGSLGVVIDKPFLTIVSVGPKNTIITNTNQGNNGAVLTFQSPAVCSNIMRLTCQKGEAVSTGSVIVKFDNVLYCNFLDSSVIVDNASAVGVKFTGGASACSVGVPQQSFRAIVAAGVTGNIGVEFDSINCVVDKMLLVGFSIGAKCTASATINGFTELCDISNCGIGVQHDAGATGNVIGARFTNCIQKVVDNSGNSTNEQPSVSLTSPYAHEDMWPEHAGQGVAASPVTINNTATDDTPDSRTTKDYWGDTIAVVAPGTITKRWISNGVNIFAGVANKIMRMEFYYPQTTFSTTRNGGNLWDLGETVLTVTDGSVIQISDKIWITSTSDPNGEILLVTNVVGNVITVASETRASGNTGVRYNHAGAETMYVIERDGLNRIDGHQDSYSAANTKASSRHMWSVPKDLPPSTGMIGRILNIDDALAASIQINVVFGD